MSLEFIVEALAGAAGIPLLLAAEQQVVEVELDVPDRVLHHLHQRPGPVAAVQSTISAADWIELLRCLRVLLRLAASVLPSGFGLRAITTRRQRLKHAAGVQIAGSFVDLRHLDSVLQRKLADGIAAAV